MQWLPQVNAVLNVAVVVLVVGGWLAIRRGDRVAHPRWMLTAISTGAVFVAGYGVQTLLQGHQRFPGDDWLRTFFVVLLGTHTVLAVVVVPMVLTAAVLALRGKFAWHRRVVKLTLPVWLYVGITGLVIHVMNNHVRPNGLGIPSAEAHGQPDPTSL